MLDCESGAGLAARALAEELKQSVCADALFRSCHAGQGEGL